MADLFNRQLIERKKIFFVQDSNGIEEKGTFLDKKPLDKVGPGQAKVLTGKFPPYLSHTAERKNNSAL